MEECLTIYTDKNTNLNKWSYRGLTSYTEQSVTMMHPSKTVCVATGMSSIGASNFNPRVFTYGSDPPLLTLCNQSFSRCS